MTAPTPDPDELDGVELTEEWASEADRHEDSAQARADRYARIHQGHQNAKPPRSWTPAGSAGDPAGTATWIKVTAIVLIAIAVLAVLAALRSFG